MTRRSRSRSPNAKPSATSWRTNSYQTKSPWSVASAALKASTAGSARPSFNPDSRLRRVAHEPRHARVGDDARRQHGIGRRRAARRAGTTPSTKVRERVRGERDERARDRHRRARACAPAAATPAAASPPRPRARRGTGSRSARRSRGARRTPTRRRTRARRAPPSPSTNPATTNTAVSDRKLRWASPAQQRADDQQGAEDERGRPRTRSQRSPRAAAYAAGRCATPLPAVLARPPASGRRAAARGRRRGRPRDRRRRLHRPVGGRAGQARAARARGRAAGGRDGRLGRERPQRRLRRRVADARAGRTAPARFPRELDALEALGRENMREPQGGPRARSRSMPRGRSTGCCRSRRSRTSWPSSPRRRRCCAATAGRRRCSTATRSAPRSPRRPTSAPSCSTPASALVDPGALALGLRRAALALGVRLYERTPVVRATAAALSTPGGSVRADRGAARHRRLSAAHALDPAARRAGLRLRARDRAAERRAARRGRLGARPGDRRPRQPVPLLPADARRPDPVRRLRRRSTTSATASSRGARAAARRAFAAAPRPPDCRRSRRSRGIAITHAWGGPIDTCSRFCVTFGRALGGRAVYAVGYTGLGVAATPLRRPHGARPARRRRHRAHAAEAGAQPAAAVPARAGALGGDPGDAAGARARRRARRPPRPVATAA